MVEVFLIIVMALIFAIVLRRVVQVKLDPNENILALHANAMAEVASESSSVSNKKIEAHIINLIRQAEDSVKNQHYSFAEKILIRVATLDPKNSTTYKLLGDLYLKQQNYKDATSSYKLALRYNPKDAFILHNLGMSFYHCNQYKKSIQYFKKSIKVEPNVAYRYISLSTSYEKIKDLKHAKFYMKKALEIEPENIAYQKLYKEIK